MKITSEMDGIILQLTREQLLDLLRQDPKTGAAGMFRATEGGLRSAVRTYLRMDRLTLEQLTKAKGTPECSTV